MTAASGHYDYTGTFAQGGCDFESCSRRAVGHAEVRLKNHSLGGTREILYLALCDQHILIGTPVERRWVEGDG